MSATNQTGLSDNAAGAIAYMTFVPAIVFLLVLPYNRNRYVRFHAWQSLLLNVSTIAISFLLIVPVLQPRIGYWPALAVVEVSVWPAEALMLCAWLRRDLGTLLGLSFVANGLSLGIGLLR